MEGAAFDILAPVMESSMILASHYAKACGRSTVTAKDASYGLMYAARNVTGRQIGSLFPEMYDESSSDEEEDIEVVDDGDEPFTRYEGTEELYVNMNRCADTWDDWVPESPIENILKLAVDRAREAVV
jgi:hypothetical protein